MVFFVCNSCGETLKKNKVDSHLRQCRSKSVSCVDCNKDFTYDYNNHNQCISEDQKYGGLDYRPKENSTKGKTKQEEWVQKVKNAINDSNCNNQIKTLLTRLSAYDNIPRKKPKFLNFVRSCLHVNNDYYAQQMWDFFDNIIKSNGNNTQTNGTQIKVDSNVNNETKRHLNGTDSQEKNNKRQKSDKNQEIQSQEAIDENKTDDSHLIQEPNESQNTEQVISFEAKPKLKISKIVVQLLKESQNNSLSLKKLKKRVIKRFKSTNDSLSKEQIETKFFSKLNKIKKIQIIEGIVSLSDQ